MDSDYLQFVGNIEFEEKVDVKTLVLPSNTINMPRIHEEKNMLLLNQFMTERRKN